MASDEITIIHQNRGVAAELSMFRKRSTSVIIGRAHHMNWKWFVQPTFNLLSRFVFHNKCSLYAILRIRDVMRCCLYSCSICLRLTSSLRPRPTCPPTQGGALMFTYWTMRFIGLSAPWLWPLPAAATGPLTVYTISTNFRNNVLP